MIRRRLLKIISLIVTVSLCLLFNQGHMVSADDSVSNTEQYIEDEEIDPLYLKFVGRLYAIVTRQDHADEEEKKELARSLKGGLPAAGSVLFHFYFSDEYRALNQSNEAFVEDLYRGVYARASDESGMLYYTEKLESGLSRYLVFREFLNSNEFVHLCYAYNIRVKQILLENYIDHLDGMTCIYDDYYDLDYYGDLGWCYKDAALHVRGINESLLDSPTEYYIIVDTQNCYIMIFKGSIGQWKLNKIYPISCGKPGHETPTGFYWVTDKLPYFYSHGSLCYYATQWNGPYYFHSVTYNYNGTIQNGNLGMHISAGCVRCRIDVAEWIYDNIPIGTAVRIM